MSTYYSFGLAVGFGISGKELFRQLGKPRKEKSHEEPRFDPKTGVETWKEKVVDESAAIAVQFGGKTYAMGLGRDDEPDESDLTSLVKAISKRVGCAYNVSSSYEGECFVVFEAPGRKRSRGSVISSYGLDVDAPLPLDSVAAASKALPKIGAALKKLGLKVGSPKVHISYSIG